MTWGVRRYRNPDGTLTEAGKKRATKQYRKYALRAQRDFNNDLTGIRIRTYNHAADKMNNGGIKKYNEDYDIDDIAKSQSKMMDDLRLIAEGKV